MPTQLIFMAGNRMKKVVLIGRKISLMTPELSNVPFTLDLDKLNTPAMIKKMDSLKMTEEERKEIKKISKLGSQKEIIDDIKLDYKRMGWKCIVEKKWH